MRSQQLLNFFSRLLGQAKLCKSTWKPKTMHESLINKCVLLGFAFQPRAMKVCNTLCKSRLWYSRNLFISPSWWVVGGGAPRVDPLSFIHRDVWWPPDLLLKQGLDIKLLEPYTHRSISRNLCSGELHFKQQNGFTLTISAVTNLRRIFWPLFLFT